MRNETSPATKQIFTQTVQTRLGSVIFAANEDALTGLWFDKQKHFQGPQPDWIMKDDHPVLSKARVQLDEYMAGERKQFDLVVKPDGTAFQQRVWQALTQIGFGQVISYGQVAGKLGAERGVRAVAAAIGRNPISIVVPCHRVVAANGALTGYAGGLDRKRQLLALEEAPHENG
ncbi:MAG: methylated-DNA--[protein]-cysteine S-methyltransferase [Burkholderiaceae bacterium]